MTKRRLRIAASALILVSLALLVVGLQADEVLMWGLGLAAFLDSWFLPFPGGVDLWLITLCVQTPSQAPVYVVIAALGSVAGATMLYLMVSKGEEAFLGRHAATKLARVRKDGFSNTRQSTRPASRGGRCPRFRSAFSRTASSSKAFSSTASTSRRDRKCRISLGG